MLGLSKVWGWICSPFKNKKETVDSTNGGSSFFEQAEEVIDTAVNKVVEVVDQVPVNETPSDVLDVTEDDQSLNDSSSFIVPLVKVAGPLVGFYLLYKAYKAYKANNKKNDENK